MKSLVLVASFGLACIGGAAIAGTPFPVKMKCPVGGESFTFTDTMSSSTWGSRPDGKPYGSWEFPKPIPECPGNRLLMFTDFNKAQIKALEPLLASAEYRALADDTTYYRMAWLAKALGLPDIPTSWLLLQASWQADGDLPRKARYQQEFIAAADLESVAPSDLGWLSTQARAVNAERELGAFDAARDRIKRLRDQLGGLPIVEPAPGDETKAQREGILGFLGLQEGAIARQDASSEPLDLITPRVAAQICLEREKAGEQVPELCRTTLTDLVKRERDLR